MRRLLLLLFILTSACTPQQATYTPPDVFNSSGPVDGSEEAVALALSQGLDWLSNPENDTLDGVDSIEPLQVDLDSLGMAHIRLNQYEAGLPVFGGQIILHLHESGEVASVTDGLIRSIEVDTDPSLSADQALDVAIDTYPGAAVAHEADLMVVRYDSVDHLAYRVLLQTIQPTAPFLPALFIDAHNGQIVLSYDLLETELQREIYDWDYAPGDLAFPEREEGDAASGDTEVDEAYDSLGQVYNYFASVHGRDSYDNRGATLTATVHSYRSHAAWSSREKQFLFGDGSAYFTPMTGSLDVMAHEFAHALTQSSAALIYRGESGALNEATSDIFGAVVESWSKGWATDTRTWRIADEVTRPALAQLQISDGGDAAVIGSVPALRYMQAPTADGMSIDHYSDYNRGMDVHYSSGIANKAFSLMVQDASLSMEDAAKIWYRALTLYMVPNTRFIMARRATIQATIDLFGDGPQATAVADAWTAVGVIEGTILCEPAASIDGWAEISGDNSEMPPATDNIDFWPSEVAVGNYTGPEIAYAWTAPITGDAKIKLVRPRPTQVNHDIFLLLDTPEGECSADQAAKRGFNDLTFEVRAGRQYFVVIDGFNGDAGPFTLRFEAD